MSWLFVRVPLHAKSFQSQCSKICNFTYMDGTYRVILRIVKAGYHPVAIAQVVEH